MKLRKRIGLASRILRKPETLMMIRVKPPDMNRTLAPDHVWHTVQDLLDSHSAEIAACVDSLLTTILAQYKAVDGAPDERRLWFENGYFVSLDALALYAMTVTRRPDRIIEVGSGNSTRFFRRAITDAKLQTRLVCIDPAPRIDISDYADEIVRSSVLDVGAETFEDLGEGDFLFIDGSHYAFAGTDTTYLFLDILPRLRAGVIVHLHDIKLPDDYPVRWRDRHYNEQYMLAVALLGGAQWSPLFPAYYLAHTDGRLAAIDKATEAGSFWMRRTTASA